MSHRLLFAVIAVAAFACSPPARPPDFHLGGRLIATDIDGPTRARGYLAIQDAGLAIRTDARVYVNNHPLTAGPSSQYEVATATPIVLGGLNEIAVTLPTEGGEVGGTWKFPLPANFGITAPTAGASVSGSNVLSVSWTAAQGAEFYELYLALPSGGRPAVKTTEPTFTSTLDDSTGDASVAVNAVHEHIDPAEGLNLKLEVERVRRFQITP